MVSAEAGVARASVRVEDPEGGPPAWRTGAIARDEHLRPLADDVAPEPDPRSAAELQSNAGRLTDCGREAVRQACRLEHEQGDAGPSGERRQPAESVLEPGGLAGTPGGGRGGSGRRAARPPVRQVDHEQVHRPTGQQRAGDRQPFIRIGRGHHDEPRRVDAPRDRLDRVERRRQVQPRDDPARRLRLCREPQRERGPPARGIAAHRHAHAPRHAAGTQDRVELHEAGREDPGRVGRGGRRGRLAAVRVRIGLHRERHCGERPDDLARIARRRRTPSGAEGRERRAELGGRGCHGPSIEHLFE